ncbi:MAG: sulfatase-like hydrolase/transferase [Saprospiraceae bacterium]|nr:sulfatase-like hydrolase/transferase [Saprospiraceae bacterium]
MRYRKSCLWALSGCLILLLSSCTEKSTPPPNIILIMADDLGYEGIACFGNDTIQTPNLDQLAAGGLRFTDFHSNGSVCTPTRAALLTGKYQQRVGLEGVIYVRGETRQYGLDTSVVTMAKALQGAAYRTGIMGKWHLGYQSAYNPIHHGFETFYGYVSGNIDFHSHYDNAGIYDWYHNLDSIYEEGYVTDLITEHAVDFIRAHKDEPFFLYVPHEAPHVPFQGRNDPAYRFSDNEFSYYGPVKDRSRAYREMVEVMDEGIGRIMKTVEELDLAAETLIVFISDNGAESFGHNGALNGAKGSLLEGGHRVPAIAYWKGRIQAGITDQTVMSFDWMPTFMTLAGLDAKGLDLDGVDLSNLLLQNQPLPPRSLAWRYRNQKALRKGPWKLFMSAQDTSLYHLIEDLPENRDLSLEQADVLQQLMEEYARWEEEIDTYTQKTK